MSVREKIVDLVLEKYVKEHSVLSFGTSHLAEEFAKKLALKIEQEEIKVKVVPTSTHIASILSEFEIASASLNDEEIDVAIEFADSVDHYFNFIKSDSVSLVRDKMIAQSAEELIVVAKENSFVRKLSGEIPVEVAVFGWKRTMHQLDKFGSARLRLHGKKPFKTETGHFVIDLLVDEIFSLDELHASTLLIPGVIETGLFIGYADRVILHNGRIQVKSRMDYSKQNNIEGKKLESSFTI